MVKDLVNLQRAAHLDLDWVAPTQAVELERCLKGFSLTTCMSVGDNRPRASGKPTHDKLAPYIPLWVELVGS